MIDASYKDLSGSLLSNLDGKQLNAVSMNPDLRKKLRVDRVKKMTLGNASTAASIEDPK